MGGANEQIVFLRRITLLLLANRTFAKEIEQTVSTPLSYARPLVSSGGIWGIRGDSVCLFDDRIKQKTVMRFGTNLLLLMAETKCRQDGEKVTVSVTKCTLLVLNCMDTSI